MNTLADEQMGVVDFLLRKVGIETNLSLDSFAHKDEGIGTLTVLGTPFSLDKDDLRKEATNTWFVSR